MDVGIGAKHVASAVAYAVAKRGDVRGDRRLGDVGDGKLVVVE